MAELFARYEVNREPRWPLVSKMLVGSLAFHLLFGLAMNYVPVARAIFGVTGNALGLEIGDEDYERTIIRDDVTMLLVGGKFQYPEGYFAQAGNDPLPVTAPPAPVPLPTATPLPPVAKLPTPLPLPKGSKDGVKGGDSTAQNIKPVPLPSLETVAKNQPSPTPAPVATPTPNPKEAANKKLDEIAAQHHVTRPRRDLLNTRPFDDLWRSVNQEQTQQPLDWKGQAEVVLVGRRSGTNNWQELRLLKADGDPALIEFLKRFVAAGGESGALKFIEGPSDFTIDLKFDGQKFIARIDALTPSPDEAKRLAGVVYGPMLSAARWAKKGDKEEIYFKNAYIKSDGANLVITMSIPQEQAKTLISEQLVAATKKPQTPPATQTP